MHWFRVLDRTRSDSLCNVSPIKVNGDSFLQSSLFFRPEGFVFPFPLSYKFPEESSVTRKIRFGIKPEPEAESRDTDKRFVNKTHTCRRVLEFETNGEFKGREGE